MDVQHKGLISLSLACIARAISVILIFQGYAFDFQMSFLLSKISHWFYLDSEDCVSHRM